MNTDPAEWTICYRKRTANRFFRVTNWSGTWSQALGMAQVFSKANPELEVYYTTTAAAEAAGRVVAEDVANILIEGKNKRIKIVEKGELPADMIARIPAALVARQRWLDGDTIAEPELTEDEAPADLIVKFERIGRSGTTPVAALTLHVPANLAGDADRVAHVVFRHCRRYLLSREFAVQVDLERRTVAIEGGRYGRGEILRAA